MINNAILGVIAGGRQLASGPVDPLFDYVELLLHCDGPDGSTIVTDSSSHGRTVAVNAGEISDSGPKFGSGSLVCGPGISYTTPLPMFEDFTVEIYVKFSATPNYSGIINLYDYSQGLLVRQNNGSSLSVFIRGTEHVFSFSPVVGTWVLYEVSRDFASGTVRVFGNGTLLGSRTETSQTLFAGSCVIGVSAHDSNEYVTGWVDEIRVTSAVRNTASYTPPTGPFPNP